MNRRYPARTGSSLASIVAVLLVLLTLSGCETTGGLGGLSGESRAERLALEGDHADAARTYIGLASEALGVDRE